MSSATCSVSRAGPPRAGPSPDETGRPGRSRSVQQAPTRVPRPGQSGRRPGHVTSRGSSRRASGHYHYPQVGDTDRLRQHHWQDSDRRPARRPGLRRDRDTAGHGVSRRTPGELFHGVHDVSLVITNRPPGPRALPANPASRCKPRDQLINLLHCQAAVDPDRLALSFSPVSARLR